MSFVQNIHATLDGNTQKVPVFGKDPEALPVLEQYAELQNTPPQDRNNETL